MTNVPRRLPPTQGQRIRNVTITHASLSGQGRTAAARPVSQGRATATIYQPEPWTQTYSYPGDLTVTPGTARIYNETARIMAVTQVRASVGTPPTGSAVVLDVKVNGVSIFADPATRPAIPVGGNVVAVTPPSVRFKSEDYLTVDIAQVGSGTAGADLTVQIRAV